MHSPPLSRTDRKRRRWRVIAWGALVLVAAISLLPLTATPKAPSGTDKLVHFGLYAGLMYCHARAWPRQRWPTLALVLAGYGAAMEVLQHFLPPRSASLADALANCVGVSIMLVILLYQYTRRRRTDHPTSQHTD